jgi:hypothetical protein
LKHFKIVLFILAEGEGEVRGSKRSTRNVVSIISVVFFLLTVCLQPVIAQQVLTDNKKKAVDNTSVTESQDEAFKAESAKETKLDSDTKKWLLYGGGVALGVGIAAAVAGGGGGGSSTPACEEPIVGPSLAGSDWAGTLDLYNRGTQAVTAIITQCGNRVLIQTTSTLEYGQALEGTISSSGHLLLIDQATQQDWTTHYGAASSTSIKLYDWVNNFHNMDKLILSRTLAE